MDLRLWSRAVRLRFITASIIAVTAGLTVAYGTLHVFDPFLAALTYLGVISLHASIDLLNDYFDFQSGIDKLTTRTPFSGGTGVLPEGLLKPRSVYRAGLSLLLLGSAIGLYLSLVRGPVLILFLVFAVVATYFYSEKIVNIGLGELTLVFKGGLIVLGAFYVQTAALRVEPLALGLVLGILSASVLFMNEFPDYDADKLSGRRNLVVRIGLSRASKMYRFFPILAYIVITSLSFAGLFPITALLAYFAVPYFVKACIMIAKTVPYHRVDELIPAMANSAKAARIAGVFLVFSYILPVFISVPHI